MAVVQGQGQATGGGPAGCSTGTDTDIGTDTYQQQEEEEAVAQGYLSKHLTLQELEGLREELRAPEQQEREGDGAEERRTLLQLRALSRSLGGVTVLLKGMACVRCDNCSVACLPACLLASCCTD